MPAMQKGVIHFENRYILTVTAPYIRTYQYLIERSNKMMTFVYFYTCPCPIII
jgi:hypothetical protein